MATQLQLPIFSGQDLDRLVNVASVPQRSPFRYPGGKTWLVPRIRTWLASLRQKPVEFIEAFAGGAIVGLTVAAESLCDHVTLVELDERIAAVWQTILYGDAEKLVAQILSFQMVSERVEETLSRAPISMEALAFQAVLMNRVNHGGIMAPGAGRIKHGENGRGLGSRWYPETLARRIRKIAQMKQRITFVHEDGLKVLEQSACDPHAAFFIDPPYTAAGKQAGRRLYVHCELDHCRLFQIASSLRGEFLMTYENATGVRRLAEQYGFDTEPIAMKNTHHAKMTELLIARDLGWARM